MLRGWEVSRRLAELVSVKGIRQAICPNIMGILRFSKLCLYVTFLDKIFFFVCVYLKYTENAIQKVSIPLSKQNIANK